MLILHKKCSSLVYRRLSVNLTSPISLSVEGLGIVQASISLPEKIETRYFCPTCNEEIKVTDLEAKCSKCYEIRELDDIFLCEDVGGIFCKKCAPVSTTISIAKAIIRDRI